MIEFAPSGRAIILPWRRSESKDRKVRVASLTPAPKPFPAPDDFTTIFVGDEMIWRDKLVTVDGFVSSDRALVTYPVFRSDGSRANQNASRLVQLAQLVAAPPK